MKDDFKEKAKTWDANPIMIQRSKNFYNEIIRQVEINKQMRILDFGCGTGLVGLNFSASAHSVFMVDTSEAMISMLREKVKTGNLQNIEIMNEEIEKCKIEKSSVDLICSLMAFHHLQNIPGTLNVFKRILKDSGCIIISDLCREDGGFHSPEKVEHNGFDPEEIKAIFRENGFSVKKLYNYDIVNKPDKEGNVRSYEQFILTAYKTSFANRIE